MISKSSLPFVFFLLLVSGAFGQEQICIPNVWKGEVVKGWVYLSNGDSLIGKFTHLTPKNDIKTTHVLYKGDGVKQTKVRRGDIIAYYDKKEDSHKWKVYINADSTVLDKGCFFDQGKFLSIVEDGDYKLLKDELDYHSSISAYNQSDTRDVYYILLPSNLLIEINLNQLKVQMAALFGEVENVVPYFTPSHFGVEEMIKLVHFVNSQRLSL